MIKVIKRDGKQVFFDGQFIVNAVLKAQEEIGQSDYGIATYVADLVASKLNGEVVSIHRIQEEVETVLMAVQPDVARAYISYRTQRDRVREENSPLVQSFKGLLDGTNKSVTNENANKDSRVFPVQRDLLAGIIAKHYGRNFLIPDHIVAAHDDGDIHFHDLDYSPFMPMTNCCLVDLTNLLKNGFKLGNAQIESPKSIGVACAVMAQITAQVASHQYGGTTFANIDKVLEPYARLSYEKHLARAHQFHIPDANEYARQMTVKEIYDGIQGYELTF